MEEYRIPAGPSEAELVEKKSRFIGQVFPAETEEEARACIEAVRKKHYDARHHCFCYRLANGTVRASDDGEPQGTAGQPMLAVFDRENVQNVVCVVTRYFGGILLGAGGLIRAYQTAAKRAMDAAGIVRLVPYTDFSLLCRYDDYPKLKYEFAKLGVTELHADFAEAVRLTLTVRADLFPSAARRLSDMSAGRLNAVIDGSHLGKEQNPS